MNSAGTITAAFAGRLEATLPGARIGDGVRVTTSSGRIAGEVCGLRDRYAIIAPQGSIEGVRAGDTVTADPQATIVPLGTMLLGRSFTAQALPLDGGPALRGISNRIVSSPPLPSKRAAIAAPLWTGVRTIDGLLTIGRGSRVGIFGPPGAGKSSLVDRMFRGCSADAVVLGLIGERGREAQEWMREVPSHACIVCATSDRSAPERIRAATVAMAQACALRERGLHVLFILDSFARFAAALREVAIANGEPPGRAGYPASVFARLASYAEHAGNTPRGSVTLLATVLSDGDERDPVSEAARSLLDGHIQLDMARAQAGKHPAIDVLGSASRTMRKIASPEHVAATEVVRSAIAALAQTAEVRSVGIEPADPYLVRVATEEKAIDRFMIQDNRSEPAENMLCDLQELAARLSEESA